MTTARWQLTEVRPGQWWAVDSAGGAALGLDEATAVTLWAAEDLITAPLSTALAMARAREPGIGSFVDLRFAGLTVRYRSDSPDLVSRVADDFAGAHAQLRSSPDVVVELSDGVDLDRLHRSVTGQRVGVRMRAVGELESEQGSDELPVIPPLQQEFFSRDYTAMHAALLMSPAGGVVVCGARRAGKTTTATTCQRLGLATVLTDELTLLHSSGAACGVALPIRERTGTDRLSYPLARTPDGARLVEVAHLVVLGSGEEPRVRRISAMEEALQLTAPHLRPLDSAVATATGTLLALLRRVEVWHWQMRPWPDLAGDIRAAARDLMTDVPALRVGVRGGDIALA